MQEPTVAPIAQSSQPSSGIDAEAGLISTLGTGSLLMPLMFMGNMILRQASSAIGWVIGKVHAPTGAAVKNSVHGLYDALQATTVSDAGNFWKNYSQARTSPGSLKPPAHAEATGIKGLWQAVRRPGALAGFFKALPAHVRGANLFSAIAVTGAAMATGSMLLSNNRATREDNAALKEFAAAVYGVDERQVTAEMLSGEKAHPMVVEAHRIYDKNITARRVMNSFGIAGDAFMVGNMTSAASGALMVGEMMLPQIGAMFSHQNPSLAIFHALKQAEAGHMPLTTEQRAGAIAELIAMVPGVAKHGGINNRYVAPVALELAESKMSVTQLVRTLADPASFNALSNKVIAKVDAEHKQAEMAKAQAAAAHPTPASATMQQTAPAAKVQQIAHQGQVEATNKLALA